MVIDLLISQLAFVPIAYLAFRFGTAILKSQGEYHSDYGRLYQYGIDRFFYGAGFWLALNVAETMAQMNGGSFGVNMAPGFVIIWAVAGLVALAKWLAGSGGRIKTASLSEHIRLLIPRIESQRQLPEPATWTITDQPKRIEVERG